MKKKSKSLIGKALKAAWLEGRSEWAIITN
jgi:hypothetical protein